MRLAGFSWQKLIAIIKFNVFVTYGLHAIKKVVPINALKEATQCKPTTELESGLQLNKVHELAKYIQRLTFLSTTPVILLLYL